MLSRKKKVSDGQDFTSLDMAVKELAKQTEELLGTPKKAKVASKKTPLKRTPTNSARSSGHSFDIISSKSGTNKTRRKHSSAPVSKRSTSVGKLAMPDRELLPEHATKNSSEVSGPNESGLAKKTQTEEGQAIVGHQGGALRMDNDKSSSKEPTDDTKPSIKPKISSTTIAGSVMFTKDVELDEVSVENQPKDKDNNRQESTYNTTLDTEDIAGNKLEGDDSAEDTKSKDHTLRKDQQKPTVFDTTEYHPQLHDWSQLDKKSRLPWVILLILLATLAGVVYFMVLNQHLPL